MEQDSKIPLLVFKNSFSIKLSGKTAEALLQQPRPILWNNNGLYCWISQRRIKNMTRVIKDQQKHAEANDLPFQLEFNIQWLSPFLGAETKEIAQAKTKEMAQAIEAISKELNEKLLEKK